MRIVAIVCLLAARVVAEPVVAIAPPSAESPVLVEAGLLMQAEASSWLIATQRSELHVKQLLRTLERHQIEPAQLADPIVAARARSLLGAPLLVFSKLSTAANGGWVLEVRTVDEKGVVAPPQLVNLPSAYTQAISAGASALASAVDKKPISIKLASTNDAAAKSYASCYAILIRQPIAIETPTVLSPIELQRAVTSCRAAVAADPKFENAWAALGLAEAIAGQDADAVQALLKVDAAKSYLPLYWLARYWLVTRYQEPAKGITALEQALKQHPGFLLARGYLAEHLTVLGKREEALAVWQAYSTQLPKNAFLRGRVSTTLAKLGRNDEAITIASGALELDRSDTDAILELGSRYLDAGRRDDAINTLQTAVTGKARGELLLRLGWAYFGKGDLDRAEKLFRRAEDAATTPGEWRTRARARADLARVCDRRGDSTGAKLAIERALDEGTAAYLRAQNDKRLVELVAIASSTPHKPTNGPRLLKPAEISPFTIDPTGDVDLRTRQFPTPPAQFELLRF